jgi:pyridoxal phosphate enzyme (YggS family)
MCIETNYKNVVTRVKLAVNLHRSHSDVSILAVSKKQPLEKIIALNKLGHKMFAESYVQEALEKIQKSKELDIEWHFIGPIQSNKTKYLAEYFDWVQSVDSLKILTRLNKQRLSSQGQLNVLLQLTVTDEVTKRGFTAEELLSVAKSFEQFENLKLRGIMSIPAPVVSYHEQLAQFNKCVEVYQQLNKIIPVDTLSLGMSSDLEAAIEAGSTMVRVGTDLFGNRG